MLRVAIIIIRASAPDKFYRSIFTSFNTYMCKISPAGQSLIIPTYLSLMEM